MDNDLSYKRFLKTHNDNKPSLEDVQALANIMGIEMDIAQEDSSNRVLLAMVCQLAVRVAYLEDSLREDGPL